MKHIAAVLFSVIWKLGGFGLLCLGILDSSFLVAPLGNDLLVVAMTSRHRDLAHMLYYAFMSSAGSVLGVVLVDLLVRPWGEAGLEKYLPGKRLNYVRGKINKNAGWALVLASMAPPPFPFTPFIVAASALQYARKKMYIVVGLSRMARFTVLGTLAIFFGNRILRWAQNPVVQAVLIGLLILAVLASVLSVVGWVKRSRGASGEGRRRPAGQARLSSPGALH